MFVKVNIACQTKHSQLFLLDIVFQFIVCSSIHFARESVKSYMKHTVTLSILSIGVCHDRRYESFVVYFALGAHMP